MAIEERKSNYIITNKVKIKQHRKLIENNLLNWINQKYTFCFSEHYEIKSTIQENTKNIYNDGFDLGFDFFYLK